MIKFILSGGYYYKAPDGGKSFCAEIIKDINDRPIKILDCLFGRPLETWEQKISDDQSFFSKHIDEIDIKTASKENFTQEIKESDIIFFQGSRPEDIINILNTILGWEDALIGKTVVASSGGASMLVKYFGVGKSNRIGEGFGLLPIKFIPHWQSDYGEELKIDWNTLLNTLEEYKEALEITKLKDGEFKVIYK